MEHKFGALAQLVERLLCKQDVNGSNPLGSTKSPAHQQLRHFSRGKNRIRQIGYVIWCCCMTL
jgi:hypothetical protein